MSTQTKPYKFQLRGVRKIERRAGRALLADDMGLGKTFQVLYWIDNYYNPSEEGPVIVVCPAGIKWQWEDQAKFHVGMRANVLSGRSPPTFLPKRTAPILIVNYDILDDWLPFLRRLRPGLVVFDEVHYIKNRSTKRTKAAKRLAKRIPYVIGLSGTPMTNRPSELFPFLNICRPDLYPSFYSFALKYCNPRRTPWGWRYDGATNLEELHQELKSNVMIRRLKKDVLKELPNKQRIVVPLDISNRRDYDMAEKQFKRWAEKHKKKRLKIAALKSERLVKMGEIKRLAGRLKLNSVIKWIEDFLEESDGKLIVFGIHKKVLKKLYAKFQDISVIVDGSVTGQRRQRAVDKFTHHKQTRLFIGNIHAAGVGWNGTVASTVAFVEMDWVPGIHTQAEDRIHRIGQKVGAMIYYLVARGTVEEHLCKVLQKKQEVLDATLDGRVMKESLNIYDQVEALILRGPK